MSRISEAISESYRTGIVPKPRINNRITRARMRRYEDIKNATGENPQSSYDYSLQLIGENQPQIQRYVMSQGEVPQSDPEALAKQAYRLRCNQIDSTAQSMGVSPNDAQVFIESEEDDDNELETSSADTFLGELAAPIGIVGSLPARPDNLDSGVVQGAQGILGGLLNIGSSIASGSELKRAAENDPAGITGLFSTGGTQHYNALRTYFQQNPSVAKQVIAGTITSEAQLPNWNMGGLPIGSNPINSNDITSAVAQYQTQQQINKYLPIVLIGVVVLIVIIVLVTRKK